MENPQISTICEHLTRPFYGQSNLLTLTNTPINHTKPKFDTNLTVTHHWIKIQNLNTF